MSLDLNLINQIKPKPASQRELESIAKLGLGDYEIFSEKLVLMCDEGREVMTRTGVTGMLHSGDLIVGIYSKDGDLITASVGTYLHIVTGQIPIKYILN